MATGPEAPELMLALGPAQPATSATNATRRSHAANVRCSIGWFLFLLMPSSFRRWSHAYPYDVTLERKGCMAGRLRAIVTLARCRILAEIGQRADRASHASGVTATELFREGKSPEQPEGQETSCRPGRPQGISANRSMPAFQATQETAIEATRLSRHELFEHLGMPAFLGGHPGTDGFRAASRKRSGPLPRSRQWWREPAPARIAGRSLRALGFARMAAGAGLMPRLSAIGPPKTRRELPPSPPGWRRLWRAGDPVHWPPSPDTRRRCRLRPASSRGIAVVTVAHELCMPPWPGRQLASRVGRIKISE